MLQIRELTPSRSATSRVGGGLVGSCTPSRGRLTPVLPGPRDVTRLRLTACGPTLGRPALVASPRAAAPRAAAQEGACGRRPAGSGSDGRLVCPVLAAGPAGTVGAQTGSG